jgi:hypothetical protein
VKWPSGSIDQWKGFPELFPNITAGFSYVTKLPEWYDNRAMEPPSACAVEPIQLNWRMQFHCSITSTRAAFWSGGLMILELFSLERKVNL